MQKVGVLEGTWRDGMPEAKVTAMALVGGMVGSHGHEYTCIWQVYMDIGVYVAWTSNTTSYEP